jgi:hypothetical protein
MKSAASQWGLATKFPSAFPFAKARLCLNNVLAHGRNDLTADI